MKKASGIIIKKQSKGEHDQILTILTREFGKMDFQGKGVRKSTAKLAGHLELFSISEIRFVSGRRNPIITSAAEQENFSALKREAAKVQSAKRIVCLADECLVDEEPDEEAFNLVLGALDYLNRNDLSDIELKFFLRYFEFKFLSMLGYEPEDKTIVQAFTNRSFNLSESELDGIARRFNQYFQEIRV